MMYKNYNIEPIVGPESSLKTAKDNERVAGKAKTGRGIK